MSGIPYTLHYCWFGGQPKPECFERCLASWRKFAPEFKIVEWNEKNTVFDDSQFLKDALHAREWAFVSDFVRLKILYEHGGVYVDTDLELTAPLIQLTHDRVFLGFEKNNVAFSMAGAEPGHPLFGKLLERYRTRRLSKNGGEPVTIVSRITDLLIDEYHLREFGSETLLCEGIHIYPADVLTVDCANGRNRAVHHFSASWKKDFATQAFIESVRDYPPRRPLGLRLKEWFKRLLQIHFPRVYRALRDRRK